MNKTILLAAALSILTSNLFVSCGKQKKQYIYNKGEIFGTYYSIIYAQREHIDLHQNIRQKMQEFDNSLSTFNRQSVISRINAGGDSVPVDSYFEKMFLTALRISRRTYGAFDITVAPLVNAWGFGFGNRERADIPNVDSLKRFTGYEKVRLENRMLLKENKYIMLDASAIAKGYASDVVAALLEENGCTDYMVEIGGEVACKGVNPQGRKWRIGIDVPKDDAAAQNREIQTVVNISNMSLATSGNYRQFYYLNGKKYSHTIDPRTAYPVQHNLLSVTVIAPTCMEADAYATAFMVLGVDSALKICESIEGMDCYLIYTDNRGENRVKYTPEFEKYFFND
ncbi:MAG: FAD:protein FMN transferase [Prevotellaceae bacterium]|jgi:thiamine biosynthesis lipoprotein|nr:FAD:protein FMN transferase [Prevotellaceae bacterium]